MQSVLKSEKGTWNEKAVLTTCQRGREHDSFVLHTLEHLQKVLRDNAFFNKVCQHGLCWRAFMDHANRSCGQSNCYSVLFRQLANVLVRTDPQLERHGSYGHAEISSACGPMCNGCQMNSRSRLIIIATSGQSNWHKTASLSRTDRLIAFARWCQCAPPSITWFL